MPNKAKSKAQFRFFEGIAHGMKPRGGGPTASQAKELLGGQKNYKSLPAKKTKKKGK